MPAKLASAILFEDEPSPGATLKCTQANPDARLPTVHAFPNSARWGFSHRFGGSGSPRCVAPRCICFSTGTGTHHHLSTTTRRHSPADRGFCEPSRIYHITEPCQFHPVQQRRGTNLAMVEPIGALSGAFADSPWDPWSKGFCSVKSDGPPQNECHALWAPLLRGQHVPWLVATPRQLAAIGKSFLFFKANHPCWGQPSYKLSECDANPIQALIDVAGTYLQEGNPTVVVRRARVERKAFFVFQQSGPKLSGKSSGLRYCEPVLGQP